MQRFELTLAILKPHLIAQPYAVEAIRKLILTSNFKVVNSKRQKLSKEEAERFYKEHEGKFFYRRLTGLMTSGPSDLYILAKENAIKDWRSLMGPTKVFKTQFEAPETIRGMFGLSDTRNCAHGSDSPESVKKEISVVFPEFNVEKWYEKEEPLFRHGNIKFSETLFRHIPTETLNTNNSNNNIQR